MSTECYPQRQWEEEFPPIVSRPAAGTLITLANEGGGVAPGRKAEGIKIAPEPSQSDPRSPQQTRSPVCVEAGEEITADL